jgi:hypothetical protein
MAETNLTGRQIWMVVLVIVMIMAGGMCAVFIALPSDNDPKGSRNTAVLCGIVAALSAIWFVRLTARALRDRRQGVQSEPAKVSGWFHVCFGVVIAGGGIACSALAFSNAAAEGAGTWTLYWGMILWGVVQTIRGLYQVRHPDEEAKVPSGRLSQIVSRIGRGK